MHFVTYPAKPLNSPFKNQIFSLDAGQQSFERLTLSVLLFI
jgi:hypothetical protein